MREPVLVVCRLMCRLAAAILSPPFASFIKVAFIYVLFGFGEAISGSVSQSVLFVRDLGIVCVIVTSFIGRWGVDDGRRAERNAKRAGNRNHNNAQERLS
eukprot:scaffold57289_cov51-Attheya_sp.AAC.3